MEQRTCPYCSEPIGDAYVCVKDAARAGENLRYIAANAAELDTVLAKLSRTAPASEGGRSPETPLPINLNASEVSTRLGAVLAAWVGVVVKAGMPAPFNRTHASLASFLFRHLEWLRGISSAPAAFDDFAHVAIDLDRAIDTPAVMIELGTCDECGKHLRARQDAIVIVCRGCEARYDVAERKTDLLDRIDAVPLDTSTIVATIAGPTAGSSTGAASTPSRVVRCTDSVTFACSGLAE